MKCSKVWLKEWVDFDLSTEKLVESLTNLGLEVDGVENASFEFEKIVVGEVLSVEDHPNADKLHICQVNTGEETLTIVCGAPNVRKGMKVPTALIGATFPDFKIKRTKLRGVESFGMMCSARELGLSSDHSGLLPFPEDAEIGQDVYEYLRLNDHVIEIELTANRGDCASILGVAREISAKTGTPLNEKLMTPVQPVIEDTFSVSLKAKAACPRYVGRIIKNVNSKAETPLWMQEKLRRAGLNSISPIVDVTNYVLMELGQPLHAFDLNKLHGEIEVRFAEKGEQLILLTEDTIELDPKDLVIADQEGPLALAGIMGGLPSSIDEKTTDIFLESAFFAPTAIAGRAREHGLQTDSSYRFERGVDWKLQRKAIEYATQLLLDIVGGEPGPVIEEKSDEHLPKIPQIILRSERVTRLLGEEIPAATIVDILTRLNMQIEMTSEGFQVIPPSYRFDISIEEDLIEEIARVYGYNTIENAPYMMPMVGAPITVREQLLRNMRKMLQDRAYHEIISYTFIDPKDQHLFDPEHSALVLGNPIASNMSVMRTNLWAGLVNVLVHNLNHQQTRIRLFETGLRFVQDGDQLLQQEVISGAICGDANPRHWGTSSRRVDFYDLKGDLEALFKLMSLNVEYRVAPLPALHPGQSAAIYLDGKMVGYLGTMHPKLLKEKGIDQPVYLFELLLEPLLAELKLPQYEGVSKFPLIRRDLAVLVKRELLVEDMVKAIRDLLGVSLVNLEIFDVYEGKGVDSSEKSVAFGLTLQDMTHTLSEDEIVNKMNQVLQLLETKFNAKLRK